MSKRLLTLLLALAASSCSDAADSPADAPEMPVAAAQPVAQDPQDDSVPLAKSPPDSLPESPPGETAEAAKPPEQPEPASDAPLAGELKPLDLSLPELDFESAPPGASASGAKNFDPRPLFKSEKKDNFAVSVAPSFSEEENEETKLPEIDGGTVSIELKTP